MDVFDCLTLIGGLCLFLFGMNLMGQALERRAGSRLRTTLEKMTSGKRAGLLTGLAITALIQSSSATTVMVVGFVNSGLMGLRQAVNVIMGANIGTTVTAWVLSLAGIDSSNVLVNLLKPSSFTPLLALLGIIFYLFCRSGKKKDTGMVLLGFATLMFGMETMSGAVVGLQELPAFRQLFLLFQNPVLGMLAGALLTAVIQSSSASVGILQALAVTGQVSYGAAIPIIMGQNIGTCVTALLSALGANKNARRAALVHLFFNVAGVFVWLSLFCLFRSIFHPVLLESSASLLGIAVAHSIFNLLCACMLLPFTGLLEKLVCRLIPEDRVEEEMPLLDERLLATPPIALQRCRALSAEMARISAEAFKDGLLCLAEYDPERAALLRRREAETDRLEDILGSYLVKLSGRRISGEDSAEAAMLLRLIGDFERIADHAVNLLESAEELREKEITFTALAREELQLLAAALKEVLDLSQTAFLQRNISSALQVEPLEQVIDELKEELRTRHILRLQKGVCSIDAGFIWSDLLTDMERCADHCSNVAACLIEMPQHNMNLHALLQDFRNESEFFRQRHLFYRQKYALPSAELPAS